MTDHSYLVFAFVLHIFMGTVTANSVPLELQGSYDHQVCREFVVGGRNTRLALNLMIPTGVDAKDGINDTMKHAATQDFIVLYSDSEKSSPHKTMTSSGASSSSSAPTGASGNPDNDEEEVEFTDSDPDGDQPGVYRAATCSLKNKRPGTHCDAYACIRGGGSCRMGPRGRCVGRKLTGPNAPVACLDCKCTKDR